MHSLNSLVEWKQSRLFWLLQTEMQLPAFFHILPDLTVKEAHYGQHIADIPTIDEMLEKIV